jgi:hypothetical protein
MNGASALKLVEPAPASEPAPAAQTPIEHAIGEAVASAVCAVALGCHEFQNGGLAPATKTAAGDRLAALYHLQQAHAAEIDFDAVAREHGRRVLRTYLDAESYYQRHSQAQGDAVLDIYLDGALEILAKVTAFMRATAN